MMLKKNKEFDMAFRQVDSVAQEMTNRFSIYLVGVLIMALFPVAKTAQAVEICDQHGIVDVNGGEYKVQNNVWGAHTAQCIDVNGTRFEVTVSNHNQDGVASYPSIFKGCHWETCTNNSGIPIRVSEIQNPAVSEFVSAFPGELNYL